jgi:hypothetical protein
MRNNYEKRMKIAKYNTEELQNGIGKEKGQELRTRERSQRKRTD